MGQCIFFWQIQFWWAVIELPLLIKTWDIREFMMLLGLSLLMFVSGALVLPASELSKGEKPYESFKQDGRWALPCLSIYFAVAFVADWHFWSINPISYLGSLLGMLILLV